jgi:hypothetical protein
MAEDAEQWANGTPDFEVGGLFFFPASDEWANEPKFLPLTNRHFDPKKNFELTYDDLAVAINGAYTPQRSAGGSFAIFHSHPFSSGTPSHNDEMGIKFIAQEMAGHPWWEPTERHMIFSLWDQSWWWYDLRAFGRVGWQWPDS